MLSIRRFDAAIVPEPGRLKAWTGFLAEQKGKAGLISSPEHFVARMTSLTTAWQFHLMTVTVSAQRLTLDMQAYAGGIWVIHVGQGNGTLRTERGDLPFAAGDLLYGKVPRDLCLTTSSEMTLQCVFFPKARMASRLAAIPAPLVGSRLKRDLGSTEFLGAFLQHAAERLETTSSDAIRPLEIAIAEFLVAAVSSTAAAGTVLEGSRGRNAIAIRATQVIEAQLSDAELAPSAIAGQVGISVRYLQKLFEETGENVNHYVRRRRLERSYDELMNPLYFGQSISEISFRWGFNDSAYFSRAFRDLFGTSPSQHRDSWRWHQANCAKAEAEGDSPRFIGLKSGRA